MQKPDIEIDIDIYNEKEIDEWPWPLFYLYFLYYILYISLYLATTFVVGRQLFNMKVVG